jgi:DinB superfamily
MSAAEPATSLDVEVFRHQAGMIRAVVGMNTEGMTQADSLAKPAPAGNCANWVLGHLLGVYNNALGLLGQDRVLPADRLERYKRGSAPLGDAGEAMDFGEMRDAWSRTCDAVDAGLAHLNPDGLDKPAPFSPSGNPNETVRSLISTVMFHQTYHAGQLGVLRRIAGKPGAIA